MRQSIQFLVAVVATITLSGCYVAPVGEFALGATDPEVLEEIEMMIAELERRARELGDGDAGEC